MKRYETVFVALADLSPDEREELLGRYRGIVESLSGTMINVDEWGKRRLAYLIQKRQDGDYTLFDYASESSVVDELERNLRLDDRILRYQTVKLSENIGDDEVQEAIEEIARKNVVPVEVESKEEEPETPAVTEAAGSPTETEPAAPVATEEADESKEEEPEAPMATEEAGEVEPSAPEAVAESSEKVDEVEK